MGADAECPNIEPARMIVRLQGLVSRESIFIQGFAKEKQFSLLYARTPSRAPQPRLLRTIPHCQPNSYLVGRGTGRYSLHAAVKAHIARTRAGEGRIICTGFSYDCLFPCQVWLQPCTMETRRSPERVGEPRLRTALRRQSLEAKGEAVTDLKDGYIICKPQEAYCRGIFFSLELSSQLQ